MSQEFNQVRYDELFQTARALAITFNLLQNGLFQGSGQKDLAIAIPFVQTMHESVMKDLTPLMEAKERQEAEASKEVSAESEVVVVS